MNHSDASHRDEAVPARADPASARPVRGASAWRMTGAALLILILFALVVLAWELAARRGLVDPFLVSQPSAIAYQLCDWWLGATSRGPLLAHIGMTLAEAAAGVAGGSLAGALVVAVCPGATVRGRALRLATAVMQPAVGIALAAALAIGFGNGWVSKAAFAALAVFAAAMADARTHRGALAGFRLRCRLALAAAVLAECFAANIGIGFLIVRSLHQFNASGIYAALVVLIAISVAVDASAGLVERLGQRRRAASSPAGER